MLVLAFGEVGGVWPKKNPPRLEGSKSYLSGIATFQHETLAGWWFQPLWKIFVKMGSSSPNKKYLKPPPRFVFLKTSSSWHEWSRSCWNRSRIPSFVLRKRSSLTLFESVKRHLQRCFFPRQNSRLSPRITLDNVLFSLIISSMFIKKISTSQNFSHNNSNWVNVKNKNYQQMFFYTNDKVSHINDARR